MVDPVFENLVAYTLFGSFIWVMVAVWISHLRSMKK